MVRPSNPKLMARVLEAVTHLGEGRGSLSRDVLDFVKRNSSGPARNLTMQVRRALKHAVNAGLLRCKSGRYKMQIALNPVKHRQHSHHEEVDSYKNADPLNDMSDDLPVGGTDPSRRVQDRQKPSRKKRAARKNRRRSSTRANRRKVTKRRTATMERRARKVNKRARRKSNADEAEDWPTRKRRMMSKRFDDEEVEDDDDDEEEEEEEEEDEDARRPRGKSPKMRSVNEDRYSDVSGDSASVQGKHRSRRSKHMANESRSPSRRGDGDAEGHRKSSKRSTRRRSQQRPRDSRQESAPEEADERRGGMDEDGADNEGMELDEDQGDVERAGTPPEHQGTE